MMPVPQEDQDEVRVRLKRRVKLWQAIAIVVGMT